MSDKPSCGSCKFFTGIMSNQAGECRRIPPVTHVLPDLTSDGEAKATVRFPQVSPKWWCGEHIARLVVLS